MQFKNFPKLVKFDNEWELEKIISTWNLSVSSLLALWLDMIKKWVSKNLLELLDRKVYSTFCKWDHFDMFDASSVEMYYELWKDKSKWYLDTNEFLKQKFSYCDINIIIDILAITSRNVDVSTNVVLFNLAYKYYFYDKNFSRLTKYIISQLERIKRWEEVSWPKIWNYSRAMKLNPDAIVVDTHILRAFWVNRKYNNTLNGSPTPLDYLHIRYYIQKICMESWFIPSEFTVSVWWWYRIKKWLSLNDYPDYIK